MVYRKVFYPSFPEFVSAPYRPLRLSASNNLPRHGLKPEGVTSANPGEKKRPIRPPVSKWQIGLG